MKVTVNGETQELPEGMTIAGLVATITEAHKGVAVAVNDEVVRRADWDSITVRDNDRVEILTAVQGG